MSAPAIERPSCWDLVEAAQAGDREAFGQLYATYSGDVLAFLLWRLESRELAHDLMATTFERALRRIDSVRYMGRDVGAWFQTIARNLILDHVKSARYRLEVPCSEFTDAGHFEDVGEAVMAADRAATLRRYVEQLTGGQREVIELRFYRGLDVSETAAAMGREVGAVKALQHRACRRLAQLVDREAV